MKILLTSDWHSDRRTEGVSRFDEVRRSALQTVDAALDLHVDLYAFLGDLCNPKDGPDVARGVGLAIECGSRLVRAKRKSVWVAGNHDPFEDGSGETVLAALRCLDPSRVHVFEKPGDLLCHDREGRVAAVAVLPYPQVTSGIARDGLGPELRAMARQPVGNATVGDIPSGIVLAHATEVDGAIEGEESNEMRRGRGVRLPLEEVPKGWVVANGHYHTPQVTPSGVIIPGALARLTFGEGKNEPRFVIVDV